CSRTTVTWPVGSQRRSRLPARSTKVTKPSACQTGPSVRPQPVVSTVGSVDRSSVDRFSGIVDLLRAIRTDWEGVVHVCVVCSRGTDTTRACVHSPLVHGIPALD